MSELLGWQPVGPWIDGLTSTITRLRPTATKPDRSDLTAGHPVDSSYPAVHQVIL